MTAYTASTNQGVTLGTWTTGQVITPADMIAYAADMEAIAEAKIAAVNALGTVTGATTTINLANGSVQTLTVGAATQLAFTGWAATGQLSDIMLEILGGSSYALTWPVINWVGPGGVITVGTTGAALPSAVTTLQASSTSPDFVYLFTMNGGSTIYGKVMR